MNVHCLSRAETIYESYNEFQAVLRPDGSLRWEPGGIFKTMCQIDITYYPFDEQKCDLTFGAWSYYTSKMNMTTKKVPTSVVSSARFVRHFRRRAHDLEMRSIDGVCLC